MPNTKKSICKPWGHEEILYKTNNLIVLRMSLKKGEETSLHKHLRRNEHFIVLSGRGHLFCEGKKILIKPGKMILVKSGQKHRWVANEDIEMIEVTVPPLIDLVRIEDKYGRIKEGQR